MRTLKRTLILILIIAIVPVYFSSCKSSGKDLCYHENYGKKNRKKNHSNYNKKYSYKAKPVRKDYVIKNKSKKLP